MGYDFKIIVWRILGVALLAGAVLYVNYPIKEIARGMLVLFSCCFIHLMYCLYKE